MAGAGVFSGETVKDSTSKMRDSSSMAGAGVFPWETVRYSTSKMRDSTSMAGVGVFSWETVRDSTSEMRDSRRADFRKRLQYSSFSSVFKRILKK